MLTESELREQLGRYRFYHNIPLTETLSTPGWDSPDVRRIIRMGLEALGGLDLRGKRVLDIGCRDGLFSFAAEKRGAAEVIGIDNDLSRGAVELLIPFFRSGVRMEERNLYELTPETFGRFDVIVFMGVLYHLRYPFWGLKIIRDLLNDGGRIVLHTPLFVDDNRRPLLHCPIDFPGDPTHCTIFNLKGLTDTLCSLNIAVEGVEYLWEHGLTARADAACPVAADAFDEAYYLKANPDAAAAVRDGHLESGFRHYELFGRAERRWARLRDGTMIYHPDQPVPDMNHAVLVCRKTPQSVGEDVAAYWEGRHRVHTAAKYAGMHQHRVRSEPIGRVAWCEASGDSR